MKYLELVQYDQKLVLLACMGCLLILAFSFLISQFNWIAPSLLIEITITAMAVFVSGICLAHIFHQHQRWARRESRLKKALLAKIQLHFNYIGNKKELSQQLEYTLESYSSIQQRLLKLSHYSKNHLALKRLIDQFNKRKASQEVLKDLGLDWS